MMALQLVLSDCADLLSEKTVHFTYNNATTAVEYLMVRKIRQKINYVFIISQGQLRRVGHGRPNISATLACACTIAIKITQSAHIEIGQKQCS